MSLPQKAAQIIKKRVGDFTSVLGIGLGSGSGDIAKQVEPIAVIPYADLPGFAQSNVAGHQSELILGHFNGVPVACLKGRAHFYEGFSNEDIQVPIRTLRLLGCKTLALTNATGSFNPAMGVGSIVLIKDHINFQFRNPLVGQNDDEFGVRFPDISDAYTATLREKMLEIAERQDIKLAEGVYLGVLGPSYETPAEVKAYRMLGGDVVGMSTVPDVIIASHCGMEVVVLSLVTNLAVGLSSEVLSHEDVLAVGEKAAKDLASLLSEFAVSYREGAEIG